MLEQNGLYSEEYGENGYMDQEEEWEREGLLDPAWEKQQKKVSESDDFDYIKKNGMNSVIPSIHACRIRRMEKRKKNASI